MKGLNKAELIGCLGSDPEIKNLESGASVANFSLATNYSVKRGDQWEEETDWHNIVIWGGLVEVVEKHLKKGSRVFVEGRLKTRKWKDKEGNNRSTTEVVVKDFMMLGK